MSATNSDASIAVDTEELVVIGIGIDFDICP